MEFLKLANVFSKLEKTSKRLELAQEIARLFYGLPPHEAKIISYLLSGSLTPEFYGIEIGIGDKLAQQAISIVSGVSISQIETIYRKTGDLGTCAFELLENKKQMSFASQSLDVKKVYDNFYKIATISGAKSQESKIKLICELLSNSSPIESKIIIRFLVGNLRMGVGESTIIDGLSRVSVINEFYKFKELKIEEDESFLSEFTPVFKLEFEHNSKNTDEFLNYSWFIKKNQSVNKQIKQEKESEYSAIDCKDVQFEGKYVKIINSENITYYGFDFQEIKKNHKIAIERAFNLRSDLGEVSSILIEKSIFEIEKIGPVPFSPIRPALAERLPSSQEIFEKLGKCVVEGKYDGLRLQIHKKEGKVLLFSRRQEPVTHMFPEIVHSAIEDLNCSEAILEGEAIGFIEETNAFLPFQQTIQRKRKHEVDELSKQIPLKLFAFELLYLDGIDLTNLPYEQRREKLNKIIKENSIISVSQNTIAQKYQDIDRYFEKCVEDGLEGIVAKDLNAPYNAGARKFAWIKLKKSYSKKLADTVDVVVIGYFLGKGKRTKFGLGGLLTAIYEPENNQFKSIAKVGSGFTEEEMVQIFQSLQKDIIKEKEPDVLSNLIADRWVRPRLVLTLTADEITLSPTHLAGAGKLLDKDSKPIPEGLALRFPRLTAIRTDKDPKQATSEQEIIDMFLLSRSNQEDNNYENEEE